MLLIWNMKIHWRWGCLKNTYLQVYEYRLSIPTKYFGRNVLWFARKKMSICSGGRRILMCHNVNGPRCAFFWYFILSCILWPFWLSKIAKHFHLLGTGFHCGLDLSHVSKFVANLRVNLSWIGGGRICLELGGFSSHFQLSGASSQNVISSIWRAIFRFVKIRTF